MACKDKASYAFHSLESRAYYFCRLPEKVVFFILIFKSVFSFLSEKTAQQQWLGLVTSSCGLPWLDARAHTHYTHKYIQTHKHPHTHTRIHTHTHKHKTTRTHIQRIGERPNAALPCSFSRTLWYILLEWHTHTHTLSLSLSLKHTHTHTHTYSAHLKRAKRSAALQLQPQTLIHFTWMVKIITINRLRFFPEANIVKPRERSAGNRSYTVVGH